MMDSQFVTTRNFLPLREYHILTGFRDMFTPSGGPHAGRAFFCSQKESMAKSTKRITRWFLALAVGCTSFSFIPAAVGADTPVAVAELRSQAVDAVRKGQFSQSNQLLQKAAELSADPKDKKLADWSKSFNEQLEQFAAERRKEYDKTVGKVKMLREKGKLIYALEYATVAQVLCDNKETFKKEAWVVSITEEALKQAEACDKEGQWLRALRLYSQLSAIDGERPDWKEKFKNQSRRLRMLALYTPDTVKKLYKEDATDRDEVEALIRELDGKGPATKPATRTAEDEEQEKANRVDWHDALRGIRAEILTDALTQTRQTYYKDTDFRKVLTSGLTSLRVLVTTPALRDVFAGLKDDNKRNAFVGFVDARLAALEKPDKEDIRGLLEDLKAQNDASIKLPEEVLVAEFADGAYGALDVYSMVIWPYGVDELRKQMQGEFFGVGIQIRSDETGNLKVVTPIEDSPAFKARIKPDSIITHIDGKSARWVPLDEAVKRITGPEGTRVSLTVRDLKGNVQEHTLTRQRLKVDTVRGWVHRPGGGWDYFIDPEQKIGYVRLSGFTKATVKDLAAAAKELEAAGAKGMILDLRHNPGGLLTAAQEVVDKFIGDGLVVSTRPARGGTPYRPQELFAAKRGDEVTIPLIVLVNQISASASEIVSGALKDHKRAIIVGERTFGKGLVQVVSPLNSQEAYLKVTTSEYYLPNGGRVNREESAKDWGVHPDIVVELTPEQIRNWMDVRQELDILREANDPAPAPENGKKRDPLTVDPQLSAALFLMRLQVLENRQL